MLRALESTHISSINKVTGLLGVATANRTAPDRTAIMSIRLQDVLLILVVGVDCTTDITNWDSEDTFPRSAVRARASPGIRNGIRGPAGSCVGIIVVAGDVVRIERRVDDVLGPLVCFLVLGAVRQT